MLELLTCVGCSYEKVLAGEMVPDIGDEEETVVCEQECHRSVHKGLFTNYCNLMEPTAS